MTNYFWQLRLITHTLLILKLNNLRFMNIDCILSKQSFEQGGQPLKSGSKHCSSFNCIKSLKTLTLIAKTSDHI